MKKLMGSVMPVLAAVVALAPGGPAHARDPGAFAQVQEVTFVAITPGAIVPCAFVQRGIYNAATQGNLDVALDVQFTYSSGGELVTVSAIRRLEDMRFERWDGNDTVVLETVVPNAPAIDSGALITVEASLHIIDSDGQTVRHSFPTETTVLEPVISQDPALAQP
jgi:hypothetical protein